MHSLFALMIFFLGHVATAAPGKIEFSLQKEKQIQYREIDVPSESQQISIVSPTFMGSYQVGLGYQVNRLDLSTRNLIDKNGQQTSLSRFDSGIRKVLQPKFEAQWGSEFLSISAQEDVGPSLLTQSRRNLVYQHQAFGGATMYFFGLGSFKQDLPESYYTDPQSLQKKQRVTRVNGQELNLGLEQILTEKWKIKSDLRRVEQVSYRPTSHTLSVASLWALSSRWTLRNDIGIARDERSQSLADDRGYFSAEYLDNQISFEWKLDSFLNMAWQTAHETEEDPRRNIKNQIGTDAFIFGVEHQLKDLSYFIQISLARSSDGDHAEVGRGGIQWPF